MRKKQFNAVKQFEIIRKCNLDCEFCYNKEERKKWKEKLDLEFIVNKASNDVVFIGGGEPLLYERIEELIEKLINKNCYVVLSTNGTIYKKFNELKNNDRFQLQVSLPAIDEKLYREITKGSIDVVLKNIKRWKDNGYMLINMPVYENNFDEIEKIADFCRAYDLWLRIRPIINANGFSVDENFKRKLRSKVLSLKIEKWHKIVYNSNSNGNREGIKRYLECYIPNKRDVYPFYPFDSTIKKKI